jgi:hypothetical protein
MGRSSGKPQTRPMRHPGRVIEFAAVPSRCAHSRVPAGVSAGLPNAPQRKFAAGLPLRPAAPVVQRRTSVRLPPRWACSSRERARCHFQLLLSRSSS